jgi:hypothetical protein
MKYIKLLGFLSFSILFVSCFGERRDRQQAADLDREMEMLLQEMKLSETVLEGLDEEVTEEAIETIPTHEIIELPDACIPILSNLYDNGTSPLAYLKAHFDTSSFVIDQYYTSEMYGDTSEVCGWTQNFANGMRYSESGCGEGGWNVQFKTNCNNKIPLYHFVNAAWFEGDNMWDIDSSHYEPPDGGAGCYFTIKKVDDSFVLFGGCGC